MQSLVTVIKCAKMGLMFGIVSRLVVFVAARKSSFKARDLLFLNYIPYLHIIDIKVNSHSCQLNSKNKYLKVDRKYYTEKTTISLIDVDIDQQLIDVPR